MAVICQLNETGWRTLSLMGVVVIVL
jgi:hypothetical protein